MNILRGLLRRMGPKTLFAVFMVALCALLVWEWTRYRAITRGEAPAAKAADKADAKPEKRDINKMAEAYKPLVESGMLGTVNKPRDQLWGILGDTALFGPAAAGARELNVGGKLSTGEKIVRIGVNEVELEKDGKKTTQYVFQETGRKTPQPPRPAPAPPKPVGAPAKAPVRPEPPVKEARDR